MVNHPNRGSRALDNRTLERLVRAAEKFAAASYDAGNQSGRVGVITQSMAARLARAEGEFEVARNDAYARFSHPPVKA